MRKKRKNKYKMRVETVGFTGNFRYRIYDIDRGYWNGVNWIKEPRNCLLYYYHENAAHDMKIIQAEECKGKPVKKLEAVVRVELIGNTNIDKDQLADYLVKEARLTLENPFSQDVLLHLTIDWGTLSEENLDAGTPT